MSFRTGLLIGLFAKRNSVSIRFELAFLFVRDMDWLSEESLVIAPGPLLKVQGEYSGRGMRFESDLRLCFSNLGRRFDG